MDIAGGGAKPTIEVGAVGIDGRDLRDRHIDGGRQGRLMGHLLKALHNGVSGRRASFFGSLDLTFTASTHSLRSSSEMDLHSRLTRGFLQ